MTFPVRRGFLGLRSGTVRAVDGISFDVAPGEALGVVGESGSGKSTAARAILRLVPARGVVRLGGRDLSALDGAALRRARRDAQMIFQDPYASLDPRMTVLESVAEPLVLHGLARSRRDAAPAVAALLAEVGLDPRFAGRYPHELSGGQRQRVGIARAVALRPRIVFADEPVSALDAGVRAQILELLGALSREHGLALVLISHDLAAVRRLARRVAVMYLGRIVELAPAAAIFAAPAHPYTRALLAAALVPQRTERRRLLLAGEAPSPEAPAPPRLRVPPALSGGRGTLPHRGAGAHVARREVGGVSPREVRARRHAGTRRSSRRRQGDDGLGALRYRIRSPRQPRAPMPTEMHRELLAKAGYNVLFRRDQWVECFASQGRERWRGRGCDEQDAIEDVLRQMLPSTLARELLVERLSAHLPDAPAVEEAAPTPPALATMEGDPPVARFAPDGSRGADSPPPPTASSSPSTTQRPPVASAASSAETAEAPLPPPPSEAASPPLATAGALGVRWAAAHKPAAVSESPPQALVAMPERGLFLVAEGDAAAEIATSSMCGTIESAPPLSSSLRSKGVPMLVSAIEQANAEVFAAGRRSMRRCARPGSPSRPRSSWGRRP